MYISKPRKERLAKLAAAFSRLRGQWAADLEVDLPQVWGSLHCDLGRCRTAAVDSWQYIRRICSTCMNDSGIWHTGCGQAVVRGIQLPVAIATSCDGRNTLHTCF